ncbi:MAG: efflux RND transporter permease subunit [Xanthomonadales bacterium]|nr:efflux RND transporter permease subunit [Xanthomonadales bacterium]
MSQAGVRIVEDRSVPVTAGSFLANAADSDVAQIRRGADLPGSYVWYGAPAGKAGPASGNAPAVTLAIAKKPGSNAADITSAVASRLQALSGIVIPANVQFSTTRDLWPDRQRQGQQADPETHVRDAVGDPAGAVHARLARSGGGSAPPSSSPKC